MIYLAYSLFVGGVVASLLGIWKYWFYTVALLCLFGLMYLVIHDVQTLSRVLHQVTDYLGSRPKGMGV